MNITILLLIFVSIFGAVLMLYLAKVRSENEKLKTKYAPIIDIETQRQQVLKDLANLSYEKEKCLEEEVSRKAKISAEYEQAFSLFVKLKNELSLVEDTLEMTEFGVYTPHFSFDRSEDYVEKIKVLNGLEKELIKNGRAVVCKTEWTVSGSKAQEKKMTDQQQKLMLRAFNGECDASLAKVRWDNIGKMEERIRKSFEAVNKCGGINTSYITQEYLELKLNELRLTHEYEEKLKSERDEQKEIREKMKEEEKVDKEIEQAKKLAEDEEARFRKALEKARREAQDITGEQLTKLNSKILELEASLRAAEEMKQRAVSRAQITKSGHVYIISNIGSFGENVFKIGLTRRLEPLERVQELSDASVPFPFDVHALLFSDDAPELENKMHRKFAEARMNLVNSRKEFFQVSLQEIESWAMSEGLDIKITKVAEARDFRQSEAMRKKAKESDTRNTQYELPTSISDLFEKDKEVA